jgi:hypothetical protein
MTNEKMLIDMYHAQFERRLTLHRALEQERGNDLLVLNGFKLVQHVGDRHRCLRDLNACSTSMLDEHTATRDEQTGRLHHVSLASVCVSIPD